MVVYDRNYNNGKLKKMGTMRIVDGALELKFKDDIYKEMIIGKALIDKIEPIEFMRYTVGRFLLSTRIVLKLEKSDNSWNQKHTDGKNNQ